ncbi:MAG: hypothetical protein RSB77_05965 [Bacilli bacterium]
MKFLKSIILCLVFSSIPITAFAATTTIDNDTNLGSPYYNRPYGYSTPNYTTNGWQYRKAGYNGDSRLLSSGKANRNYNWAIERSYKNVNIQVYLNDTQFTDPRAEYSVMTSNNKYSYTILKKLNQHLAPGGWNTVGNLNVNGALSLELTSSGSGNTGADGIRIVH